MRTTLIIKDDVLKRAAELTGIHEKTALIHAGLEALMNYPAASCGVSSSVLARHSVLDTESSRALWIPASAGMTNSRQAAGYQPATKMKVRF